MYYKLGQACVTNLAALFYYKLGQALLQIGAASLLQIGTSVFTNLYTNWQSLLQNRASITN